MVIPTVARSRADLVAPFVEDGCFAGLSIEQLEVFLSEDRIWAEFEDGGDAHAFGARWAAFSRASVFPTLAAGLDSGRVDPRAAARCRESSLASKSHTPRASTRLLQAKSSQTYLKFSI